MAANASEEEGMAAEIARARGLSDPRYAAGGGGQGTAAAKATEEEKKAAEMAAALALASAEQGGGGGAPEPSKKKKKKKSVRNLDPAAGDSGPAEGSGTKSPLTSAASSVAGRSVRSVPVDPDGDTNTQTIGEVWEVSRP